MQTSRSWSSLNARFHRDRAELTGHWDPRPERNAPGEPPALSPLYL